MNYMLLSGIGDTDPMRDGYDGAMLHIVRKYKPRKVYLFFTADMEARDREKDCYARAIRVLDAECEIEKIYSGIEDPSDFDAFYQPFGEALNRITEENSDSAVLLNVSSGTPQLKCALCLEALSRQAKMHPIQVKTPRKDSNSAVPHFDWKSDIESEMENNLDSLEDAPNRCESIGLEGYEKAMIKRQIKSLVESYEYKGAYDIISKEENAKFFTERLCALLKHAYYRSLPDKNRAKEAAKTLGPSQDVLGYSDLYPIEQDDVAKACEYYVVTELRRKRGELADFMLRLHTLAENLLTFSIDKKLAGGLESIANKDRRRKDDTNDRWKLDREKFKANEPKLFAKLDSALGSAYRDGAEIRLGIKEEIAKIMKIKGYEKVDSKLRNNLAHTLISITEQEINKTYGTTSQEMSKKIRSVLENLYGTPPDHAIFSVFERINEAIYQELDQELDKS